MSTNRPGENNPAARPTTASTIGYDSAQKEGYDTSTHAKEAGRTTDGINANANTVHNDRAIDERDAQGAEPTGNPPKDGVLTGGGASAPGSRTSTSDNRSDSAKDNSKTR